MLYIAGFNTASVLIEEITKTVTNDKTKKLLSELGRVIRGPQDSLRAVLPHDEPLSVQEQIDCLLEHAMDPEILGRSYVGLTPYM